MLRWRNVEYLCHYSVIKYVCKMFHSFYNCIPICFRPVLATWEKFHKGINRFGLYRDDDPAVDAIMEDMTSQQIVDIGELLCYLIDPSYVQTVHG